MNKYIRSNIRIHSFLVFLLVGIMTTSPLSVNKALAVTATLTGAVDSTAPTTTAPFITGWAKDSKAMLDGSTGKPKPVQVYFFLDKVPVDIASANDPSVLGSVYAGEARSTASQNPYGFKFSLPQSVLDGNEHTVYVAMVNYSESILTRLSNYTKKFKINAPLPTLRTGCKWEDSWQGEGHDSQRTYSSNGCIDSQPTKLWTYKPAVGSFNKAPSAADSSGVYSNYSLASISKNHSAVAASKLASSGQPIWQKSSYRWVDANSSKYTALWEKRGVFYLNEDGAFGFDKNNGNNSSDKNKGKMFGDNWGRLVSSNDYIVMFNEVQVDGPPAQLQATSRSPEVKTWITKMPYGASGYTYTHYMALDNDTVFLSVTNPSKPSLTGLYAYDAKTGVQKWFVAQSSALEVGAKNGLVYYGDGVNLIARSQADGKEAWKKPGLSIEVITNDLVITRIPSGEFGISSLRAYNAKTGVEAWTASLRKHEALDVLASEPSNVLLTTSATVGTSAFELSTGQRLWSSSEMKISKPMIVGNRLYGVLASVGYVAYESKNSIAGTSAPSITTQPSSKSVPAGKTVSFYANVAGTHPLTYQWQKNGTNISGATYPTYSHPAELSENGAKYTCVIKNAYGTVTSSAATLTVTKEAVIGTQPKAQSAILGEKATFQVTAYGADLKYQWQKNGVNISGATASTYTTPAVTKADRNALFRVKVTGGGKTVTSADAKLTVRYAPTITTQPVSKTGSVGGTVTFSVTATSSPDTIVSYQWQKKAPGKTYFANVSSKFTIGHSRTYTTPALTTENNGTVYRVKVWNITKLEKISNEVTLTVK